MLHAWMMMLAPKVLPEPQPLSEPFTAHTHAHTHQQVIEYNNTKMLRDNERLWRGYNAVNCLEH